MKHPYETLRPEYERLLGSMVITRPREVEAVARKLLQPSIMDQHRAVEAETGVPAAFLAVLFEREASSDFRLALGQGDPWNRVSTHVPAGKGPFRSWRDAAIYYVGYDHLNDNTAPWSMPYCCWKGEAWNGFGPRSRGRPTGYLWSGTSIYDPPKGPGGKYIADGVWSGSTVDRQLGIVLVMLRMIQIDSSLDDRFGLPLPAVAAPSIIPTPEGVGGGAHNTVWVQTGLNKLGQQPPLLVDGNYGRRTREAVRAFQIKAGITADGLAGPQTFAAMEKALAGLVPGSGRT